MNVTITVRNGTVRNGTKNSRSRAKNETFTVLFIKFLPGGWLIEECSFFNLLQIFSILILET